MEESLIIRAFDQVFTLRRPQYGLITHSDQGGQYFGKIFRAWLDKWKCHQSMAKKENPYQNAHAESLWSRLKAELLKDGRFESLQDAHDESFNYIEGYYNIRRLHSSLGYLSPINFENSITKLISLITLNHKCPAKPTHLLQLYAQAFQLKLLPSCSV